ncbi:MAG: phosphotransferase family protein [Promethearchaeia archaeon]
MSDLNKKIKKYLQYVFGKPVSINQIKNIPEEKNEEDLKQFGYGENLLVDYSLDGTIKSLILTTMEKNRFGHEFFYDRAKELLFAHSSYNRLPKHVNSIDIGVYTQSGAMESINNPKEFFQIVEKADGAPYYRDLENLAEKNEPDIMDIERAKALSDYLVDIHSQKKDEPLFYRRRIRELIGDGECIMGLTDSYALDYEFITQQELKRIEKKCIDWRYTLRNYEDRLSQVHGDFHPWNVLFDEKLNFSVLDRSRGEWGEPADDVVSMSMNYLFFALQWEKAQSHFLELFDLFWGNYLEKSGDSEILIVAAPFFAWRCLVIASPIWYPNLKPKVRTQIIEFIEFVLDTEELTLNKIKDHFVKGDE